MKRLALVAVLLTACGGGEEPDFTFQGISYYLSPQMQTIFTRETAIDWYIKADQWVFKNYGPGVFLFGKTNGLSIHFWDTDHFDYWGHAMVAVYEPTGKRIGIATLEEGAEEVQLNWVFQLYMHEIQHFIEDILGKPPTDQRFTLDCTEYIIDKFVSRTLTKELLQQWHQNYNDHWINENTTHLCDELMGSTIYFKDGGKYEYKSESREVFIPFITGGRTEAYNMWLKSMAKLIG